MVRNSEVFNEKVSNRFQTGKKEDQKPKVQLPPGAAEPSSHTNPLQKITPLCFSSEGRQRRVPQLHGQEEENKIPSPIASSSQEMYQLAHQDILVAESLYGQLQRKQYKMPGNALLVEQIEEHGRRQRSEWRSVPEPDEIAEGEFDLDVSELPVDEGVIHHLPSFQTHEIENETKFFVRNPERSSNKIVEIVGGVSASVNRQKLTY